MCTVKFSNEKKNLNNNNSLSLKSLNKKDHPLQEKNASKYKLIDLIVNISSCLSSKCTCNSSSTW